MKKIVQVEVPTKCEVCLEPIEEGANARVIEHTWTVDSYRHEKKNQCIHALSKRIDRITR